MEKIYSPKNFDCTEPIALAEYFAKCSEAYLKMVETNLSINNKKMEELINCCKLLNPKDDGRKMDRSKRQTKKNEKTSAAIAEGPIQLKKRFLELEGNICKLVRRRSATTDIKSGTEFAVSIHIFYPSDADPEMRSKDDATLDKYNPLRFSHEIVALGSNTLADLRDKILCCADFGLRYEVEDPTKELPPMPSAKEKYPSGFIFIENVFYNDMRHKNATDYSEVLCDYAKIKGIGPLLKAEIDKTKISDLTIRFGYPYIYQHQSDCEHIILFADAWLLVDADPLNTKDYPYVKTITPSRAKLCILCYKFPAKWVCHDSEHLPVLDALVCHGCLMDYCYKDGEKIGNFKLYQYFNEDFFNANKP